jgi:hypothetical protein
VAETLLHDSMVPIVVAPRELHCHAEGISRVGVAVAGTPESDAALLQAQALGGVLTVIAADGAEALGLDLLVVGSRSYGPPRTVLLGAVTRRLLDLASCPVMVVPRLPDPAHEVALAGGMETALEA